ncbi:MAG: type II toxin-antitoxin system VapC family toxin [Phreatobacter sp.]|jgi:predicted nucleic acid-binding protein|uniref:type II toxin-antitoxin system VapC family toxin n=1 Tax=Phreatobacter sp. TaxID=1966341 RepID=UPI0040356D0D
MSAILVDSNILLDVLTTDARWSFWSAQMLEQATDHYRLVINPIIFAEVSQRFSRRADADAALPPSVLHREALPYDAAFLAGKSFLAYRRRGGQKTSPLPDFFIGAHATVAGYRLLTRDVRRYRTYFPDLALIAPD